MNSARLEAFTDGVIAIIITIMVLELKAPHATSAAALLPLTPVFFSYLLSFVYVGIYWNNHHHMLHVCDAVTGAILWANLHLLFWLSLFPFTTAWVGENPHAAAPTALYGAVLLMAALSYAILQHVLIRAQGRESLLRQAVGADWKGKISAPLYAAGIGLAFVSTPLAQLLYTLVAIMWCVPDRRIERLLIRKGRQPAQGAGAGFDR